MRRPATHSGFVARVACLVVAVGSLLAACRGDSLKRQTENDIDSEQPGVSDIGRHADRRRNVDSFKTGNQGADVVGDGQLRLDLDASGDQFLRTFDSCEPTCTDTECGDDGCGGSCGTCPAESICVDGLCQSQEPCPVAVIEIPEGDVVLPQTVLHLSGIQSVAAQGEIVGWQWSVDQPVGSQGVFVPTATFPNPTFQVNVAGVYTFRLTVRDDNGVESCEPAHWEVMVNGCTAIVVELVWHNPGEPEDAGDWSAAGSDLDLHFVHHNAPSDPDTPDLDGDGQPDPYFDIPWDCFWFNSNPDWGSYDPYGHDDPSLDGDFPDAVGYEFLVLDVPEPNVQYRVAVHHWDDNGFGPARATVRIYIYGALVFEVADVELVNHDMWCVAHIEWPSAEITLCQSPDGAVPWITPDYEHPTFPFLP